MAKTRKSSGGTPVTVALDRAGIDYQLHPYAHDPAVTSYGLEAAEALRIAPQRVFKTLLVDVGSGLAVGVLPVSAKLDLKALAVTLGAKRATMADPHQAQRATGYVVGGISPIGQRTILPTVVDESALGWDTVLVSGGKRGLDIELAPRDLIAITAGTVAAIAA